MGKKVTKETLQLIGKTMEEFPSASQTQIAAFCGVSSSTLCKYLHGDYNHLMNESTNEQSTRDIKNSDSNIKEINNLIVEQKRANDLLQVIGTILADGLLPAGPERDEKRKLLTLINRELDAENVVVDVCDPQIARSAFNFAQTLTREQVLSNPSVTHWYRAYRQYCADNKLKYPQSQNVVTREINARLNLRTEKNARDQRTGKEIRTFIPNEPSNDRGVITWAC